MIYCTNLQQLINNGYVDGQLVYLQKLAVPSTMDENLRICQYYIQCGSTLDSHPKDTSGRLTLRNMTLLEQLQNRNNQFIFNLELPNTAKERMTGDSNNPSPIRIYHCPYCGEHYEYEPNLEVN